jgi:RNA polymerase sigma factor (sigma-70 family)
MPDPRIPPPAPDSDGALALAVRHGRDGALERLVRRHQDELFTYAAGLLRDDADAQEVVQDAFLRAHDALVRRYDDDRCRALRLRPWLFRIVRNVALNRPARGARAPSRSRKATAGTRRRSRSRRRRTPRSSWKTRGACSRARSPRSGGRRARS